MKHSDSKESEGCPQKARELVAHLQVVMGEAKDADRGNERLCSSLSCQEIHALLAIGRRDPCAMKDLAEALRLSLPSVTGLVDKLEAKRLARRDRCPNDRRVVYAALTEAGRAAHRLALDGHIRMARRLLSALSPGEQDALVALFGKVAAAVEREKEGVAAR